MATNLLIGVPQHLDQVTSTSGPTLDNPIENLYMGARGNTCGLATASNAWLTTLNFASSRSVPIDFFYVARANLLKAKGSTRCMLKGYNGSSLISLAGTAASFQSKTLYGPRSEDAIFTGDLANSDGGITMPSTGSYTYLEFHGAVAGGATSKYKCSKVMLGQWLDFGRDPEYPHTISKEIRSLKDREACYRLTFTWRGITDAKRNELITKVIEDRQKGLILYTRNYHDLLLEHRVIHAQVYDWNSNYLSNDNHEVSITFEELI